LPIQIDRAERRERLSALAAAIGARREELILGIVRHAGRIRRVAVGEVDLALARLRAFGEIEERLAGREPLGTVAIVLPGNASISNPVATIGTAFLAGNSVVARLPRALHRWAAQLEPLFTDHLPGVRFDHGPGPEFVHAMLADPDLGVLMVFGDDSWALGYEAAVRSAGKKFIFEGPGKDPFVVLPGADLECAARDAVRGAYYNAGQACTSPERFYVHADLVEDFTTRVIELTGREVMGEPERDDVTVGPIASPRVTERIALQLRDAAARGARTVAGGRMIPCTLAGGTAATYVEPTVMTAARADMLIMRDETFGPVIPIQQVDSEAEAIELAGASHYGLSANLYGGSDGAAQALGSSHGQVFRQEIWLDYFGRNLHAPYGGRKRSGWVWERQGERLVRRDGVRVNAVEFSRAAL
jgi:betaine-aldehyde dehydrogenase